MFDRVLIANEQAFDEAGTRSVFFDPALDALGLHEAETPNPSFAASDVSAAEAALIIAKVSGAAGLPRLSPAGRASRAASRAIDLIIASLLCVVLAPIFAAIAILLTVLDPGPIVFAHRRIGKNGKPFNCLKFRTMCADADHRLLQLLAADEGARREWTSTQKLLEDPRVTRIGRILRNTSLDELPQLINVLRGEMSLVGPRPVVADELDRYGRYAAEYLSVKPGLTGLWQVSRNSRTTYRRRVATDVYYVRNQSLAFDFRILLATIPAVLFGGG